MLRRLNRAEEAEKVLASITADMAIIENASYHELQMLYRGAQTEERPMSSASGLDAVTIGYGVANWHCYNGRRDQARKMFATIVDASASQWPAFGYIAPEAELARDR